MIPCAYKCRNCSLVGMSILFILFLELSMRPIKTNVPMIPWTVVSGIGFNVLPL